GARRDRPAVEQITGGRTDFYPLSSVFRQSEPRAKHHPPAHIAAHPHDGRVDGGNRDQPPKQRFARDFLCSLTRSTIRPLHPGYRRQIFPNCCNNSTAGPGARWYRNPSDHRGMVVTMSHATRLAILAAALTLAASAAQAFTMTNQGTTGTSGAQGGSSYGNTLTDPGSAIRNYGGA